jgi:hypothetical protein
MKLKSFCTTKEMVSKLKRTSTEWEKIFASVVLFACLALNQVLS